MRAALGARRGAHGDLPHAGGAGRDRHHHDGGGIGGAPAGHVDAGAPNRAPRPPPPADPRGSSTARGLAQLGVDHGAHVGDRGAQAGEHVRARARPTAASTSAGATRRSAGASSAWSKRSREAQHRAVAAVADLVHDVAHRRLHVAGGRRQGADLGRGRVRAQLGDPHERLTPPARARAPPARRSAAALSLWATGLATSRAVQVTISSTTSRSFSASVRAGGGEVHDPVDQAGERRQLHRALHRHDLGLPAGVGEVPRGDAAGTWWPRARARAGAATRRARRRRGGPPPPSRSGRSPGRAARRPRARAARAARPCPSRRCRRRRAPRRWARRSGASSRSRRPRTGACGRWSAPRRCRRRAGRAGRACPSNSAPRGTAILRPGLIAAAPPPPGRGARAARRAPPRTRAAGRRSARSGRRSARRRRA